MNPTPTTEETAALVAAALAELEHALAALPAPLNPGAQVMRAGSLLRVSGDRALADADLWSGLGPHLRCRAYAHAASVRRLNASGQSLRGAPPSPALAAHIADTLNQIYPSSVVETLADGTQVHPISTQPELALALWAGMPVTLGGPGFLGPSQAALDLAFQWGVPADLATAERTVVEVFGISDISSDTLRCTLVKAHADSPAEALAVAGRIGIPSLRLHALFELAVAVHAATSSTAERAVSPAAAVAERAVSPAAAVAERAVSPAAAVAERAVSPAAGVAELAVDLLASGEASYLACKQQELWPGLADLQIAAIRAVAGAPAAAAQTALQAALKLLAGMLAPDVRARIYRLALVVTPLLGVAAWRTLAEQLLSDRQVPRDPFERANLHYEIAATTAHFVDPRLRSEALGDAIDLTSRVTDPALRGLVCAELARRTVGLTDRNPGNWIAEARKSLVARQADAPFLAQTLRLLAQTDASATLTIVKGLARPADRALGAMIVAETASGITDEL